MDYHNDNRIVSIGYIGIKKCYLNVSKADAITRYMLSEKMTIAEFEDAKLPVDEIIFLDEFEAYQISE